VGEEEWPVSSSGCFTVGETGLMCPKTRLVTVAKRKIVTPLGIEQLLPVTQPSPTLHILAILAILALLRDRLCGLVVRVSGYRYRGPGFDPRRYQIF